MIYRERRPAAPVRPLTKLATGWLTMFVIGSDLFVVSPLLPMIAADYGIQPGLAGLMVTLFSVSYMVSAPLLGVLADRIGCTPVLTYCLIAFGAANLITAGSDSFAALLAARMIAGATAAGVSPSVYALVAGAAPSDQRATWMAVVVSGLLLSLSFGAPIGLLAGVLHGWQIVFAALGILSLLLAWTNTCVWCEEQHAQRAAAPYSPLAVNLVIAPLAPTVIWSASLYAMYTYLGEGLDSSGYSASEIVSAILFYGWGAIVGILVGGRMTDRFGAKSTTAIALAGLGLCFLLLRFALEAKVLVNLAFGLSSATAQLFFSAQQVRLANKFPARRTTILAWNNSALFLGISLGSMIGGLVTTIAGFDAELMISAAIAVIGWVVNRVDNPVPVSAERSPSPAAITQHRCLQRPSEIPRGERC